MLFFAPTPPDRTAQKYSSFGSPALPVFGVCAAWRQKSTKLAALIRNWSVVPNASKSPRVGNRPAVTMGRPSVGGRRKVWLARNESGGMGLSARALLGRWSSLRELRATVFTPFVFPFHTFFEFAALSRFGLSWHAPARGWANPSLKRTCLRQAA
jgi:hypothetical protein